MSMLETEMVSWDVLSSRVGRNDLVALLVHNRDRITPEDLPRAICQTWSGAEYPEQLYPSYNWVDLIGECGLIVDGEQMDRESTYPETVTVYRGCHFTKVDGMSWTTDIGVANWFMKRWGGGMNALIELEVPREYIMMESNMRGEHELVIEVEALKEDGLFNYNVVDVASPHRRMIIEYLMKVQSHYYGINLISAYE